MSTSFGRRREGCIESGGIVLVDENDFEMAFGRAEAEQAMGAAVTVMRRHHALARLKAGQDQVDRGHPARDDDGPRTALQPGERVAKLIARRIAGPGIVISSRPLETPELIAARQIYWRRHRSEGGILADAVGGGDGLW